MSQIPKSGSKNFNREVKSDPNSPYSPQDGQAHFGRENLGKQLSPVRSGSEDQGLSSKIPSPKRSPQRQVRKKSRSRDSLPDRHQVDKSPSKDDQDGGSAESGSADDRDPSGNQQRVGSTSRSRIIKLRNLEDLI